MSGPSRRTRQRNQAAFLARLDRGRLVARPRMETRVSRRIDMSQLLSRAAVEQHLQNDDDHTPYFSLINRLRASDVPLLDSALDRSVVDLTCDVDNNPGTVDRNQAVDDDEILIVSENIRTNSPVILDQVPAPVRGRGPSVIVANNFSRRDSPVRVLEEIITTNSDQNVNPAVNSVAADVSAAAAGAPIRAIDDAVVIQCPVCLDTVKEMRTGGKATYVTSCGHVFCKPCIEEAITASKSCPTCRKRLRVKDAHPIFL